MLYLLDLPQELLWEILSRCSVTVRLVCPVTMTCYDKNVNDLRIDPNRSSNVSLLKWCLRLHSVRSLHIQNVVLVSEFRQSFFNKIQHLKLDRVVPHGRISLPLLESLVVSCCNLEIFPVNLEICCKTIQKIEIVCTKILSPPTSDVWSKLSNINFLKITCSYYVGESNITQSFTDATMESSKLEYLHLTIRNGRPGGLEFLRRMPSCLRHLILVRMDSYDEHQCDMESFMSLRQLINLDFSVSCVYPEAAPRQHVDAIIPHLYSSRETLQELKITVFGQIQSWYDVLGQHTALRKLVLTGCPDITCVDLKSFVCIQELHVIYCRNVQKISICRCSQFKILYIWKCEGLKEVCIKKCPVMLTVTGVLPSVRYSINGIIRIFNNPV